MYVLIIPVILIGWLISTNSISEDVAYNVAEGLGYTDVEVTSKEIWFIQFNGCGESDQALFHVHGVNPAGNEDDFIVCAGIFKGGTPRFT